VRSGYATRVKPEIVRPGNVERNLRVFDGRASNDNTRTGSGAQLEQTAFTLARALWSTGAPAPFKGIHSRFDVVEILVARPLRLPTKRLENLQGAANRALAIVDVRKAAAQLLVLAEKFAGAFLGVGLL